MLKINLDNAVKVYIEFKRGNTFLLKSLKFFSDTAKTIPLNITGYNFRMQVKNADGEVILLFVTPTNFIIHDTNQLDIKMVASQATVDASPVGEPYVYDLVMTDTASTISTVMYGPFEVKQNVTDNV